MSARRIRPSDNSLSLARRRTSTRRSLACSEESRPRKPRALDPFARVRRLAGIAIAAMRRLASDLHSRRAKSIDGRCATGDRFDLPVRRRWRDGVTVTAQPRDTDRPAAVARRRSDASGRAHEVDRRVACRCRETPTTETSGTVNSEENAMRAPVICRRLRMSSSGGITNGVGRACSISVESDECSRSRRPHPRRGAHGRPCQRFWLDG